MAVLLGYAGGRAFEDDQVLAFGVSFGAGLCVIVLIEVVRRALGRRGGDELDVGGEAP